MPLLPDGYRPISSCFKDRLKSVEHPAESQGIQDCFAAGVREQGTGARFASLEARDQRPEARERRRSAVVRIYHEYHELQKITLIEDRPGFSCSILK